MKLCSPSVFHLQIVIGLYKIIELLAEESFGKSSEKGYIGTSNTPKCREISCKTAGDINNNDVLSESGTELKLRARKSLIPPPKNFQCEGFSFARNAETSLNNIDSSRVAPEKLRNQGASHNDIPTESNQCYFQTEANTVESVYELRLERESPNV